MKWLAMLLMIANVALYLWMSGHQGETAVGDMPAKSEVNRSGMLLLSEIRGPAVAPASPGAAKSAISGQPPEPAVSGLESGDKAASAPPGTREQEAAVEQQAAAVEKPKGETAVGAKETLPRNANTGPAAEAAPATTPTQPNTGQKMVCFRVGPFKEKQQLNAVSSALREESVSFRTVQSKGRQLKATRVYLGPFPSRAEAGAMVKRLKSMGLPAYIYRSDGGQLRVSLGYFTQEELARKYTAALERKGVQAIIEPEFKTLGPFDWLEIRVRRIKSGSIKGRNWGEREVEVKSVACPA